MHEERVEAKLGVRVDAITKCTSASRGRRYVGRKTMSNTLTRILAFVMVAVLWTPAIAETAQKKPNILVI
jgi:hypothetical protein